MDPMMTPIKSVLPSGLQIITVRTSRTGILGGQIRMGVGTVYTSQIDPRWEGLDHFGEHLRTVGASRNYAPDEIKNIRAPELFFHQNALTNLVEGAYFADFDKDGNAVGQVLTTGNFWPALEMVSDALFFPRFDTPTIERERKRIVNEIGEKVTPLRFDDRKLRKLLLGPNYFGLDHLGTIEQVLSYTRNDCVEWQNKAYVLRNASISIVGDIEHQEAVERIAEILKDVPAGDFELPSLEKAGVQRGEFRRFADGVNEGHLRTNLHFPAANFADQKIWASIIAVYGLSEIIADKVISKFGLYTAGVGYTGLYTPAAGIYLLNITNEKDNAADALRYSLEIMQDPQTIALLAERHDRLVGRKINDLKIDQPRIEETAHMMLDWNSIKGPLLSTEQLADCYGRVTPDDVVQVLNGLNASNVFLEVRGDAGSLDAIPSIDIIDAWRSSPEPPSHKNKAKDFPPPPP